MKGCGKKFFVRRGGDGLIAQRFGKCAMNDETNLGKKVLLVCGNNLSHTLCSECKIKEDANVGEGVA